MVVTILVTGATGTVGREVVKQLSQLKKGFIVRAAIHTQNKIDILKQIINQNIDFVNLDYSEPGRVGILAYIGILNEILTSDKRMSDSMFCYTRKVLYIENL